MIASIANSWTTPAPISTQELRDSSTEERTAAPTYTWSYNGGGDNRLSHHVMLTRPIPHHEDSGEYTEGHQGATASVAVPVTQRLYAAWIERNQRLLDDWGRDDWLRDSIILAERYLKSLQSVDEYRLFLASYMMLLRTSSSRFDSTTIETVKRHFAVYASSPRSMRDAKQFIRQMRSLGFSPTNFAR